MRRLLLFCLLTFVNGCAIAQLQSQRWNATIRVLDTNGQPVPEASVSIDYDMPPPKSEDGQNELGWGRILGKTDTNGVFVASHTDLSQGLAIRVEKTGYYPSTARQMLYFPGQSDLQAVVASRNPIKIVTLTPVGQPIPMFASRIHIEIPDIGRSIGFDLLAADWVEPYGKGKNSDFLFLATRRWNSRNDFESSVKLTFSNPGDGLIPVSVQRDEGSALRLPALAPDAGYIPDLLKVLNHTPTKGWEDNEGEKNKNQNYFFRVRTVLDAQGNIKSALYGKIYGDFSIDPINSKTMRLIFTYYVNPDPNSRNVEFDPKRNLNNGKNSDVKEP